MSILCTKHVVATWCQCWLAAVIRRDITNDSWRFFCFCSAELRIGPHGPGRGCLLSANIIMLFVCVWRSCVVMFWAHSSKLYAFIRTLPSVSAATSFSLLLFYNSTYCSQCGIFVFFRSSSSHSLLLNSSFVSLRLHPPPPFIIQ